MFCLPILFLVVNCIEQYCYSKFSSNNVICKISFKPAFNSIEQVGTFLLYIRAVEMWIGYQQMLAKFLYGYAQFEDKKIRHDCTYNISANQILKPLPSYCRYYRIQCFNWPDLVNYKSRALGVS